MRHIKRRRAQREIRFGSPITVGQRAASAFREDDRLDKRTRLRVLGQAAAATELDIVGMRPDRQNGQRAMPAARATFRHSSPLTKVDEGA